MKKMIRLLPLVLLGGMLVLVAGSCSDSDDLLGDGQGTMTVAIHDQAGPDVTAVLVTFSMVEVHQVGDAPGTWMEVGNLVDTPIDVLPVTDPSQSVTIANSGLPAGDYDGLRITVSELVVQLDDNGTPVDVPVTVPGVPIVVGNMPTMTLDEDGNLVITVDFPVDALQVVGMDVTWNAPELSYP